jgi:hypothetical protein
MRQCISYTQTSRKYCLVFKEVLYNILNEFGVTMKLVKLIKMSLYKTYIKAGIGKFLSVTFRIQNCL